VSSSPSAAVAGSATLAGGAAGGCQVRVPALRPVMVAPIYTAPGGTTMAEDLHEAEQLAAMLAERRAGTAPDTPTHLRPTVYVVVGCDCVRQSGRYHIHLFDPRGLTSWRATHEELSIVAAYPV
jgi:hypothetical protein